MSIKFIKKEEVLLTKEQANYLDFIKKFDLISSNIKAVPLKAEIIDKRTKICCGEMLLANGYLEMIENGHMHYEPVQGDVYRLTTNLRK